MGSWSDEEILAGMRDPARRERAFRELQGRYVPCLLGLLARMCHGDRETAEDVLVRALYKAYRALAEEGTRCRALSSWLYTVASRTALDELARIRSAEPPGGTLPLAEELTRQPAPEAEGRLPPEIGPALDAVLERLDREDARYRVLLEMEHVGACDRGEMAEATGIPRKQLAQYLKRARERFARLAREYPALASLAAEEEGE
ncbi:MAG: RNA polymerase sigma factor [Armatimonadota bacterium]